MKRRRSYPKEVYDFFGENKKAYFSYLSFTNKVDIFSKYISKRLNQRRIKKDLRILCIGGGSGETDLNIIKRLRNKDLAINYIDPSSEMRNLFIKKAIKLGLKRKLGRLDLARFETDSYQPPKSDIILCISSVYFLEDWGTINDKSPFLKIYNNLNENGTAVFVLKSDKSDHCAVKRVAGGGRTCGGNIRTVLRQLKIPHYWETLSTRINMSSCFQDGEFKPNKQGIQLLSFMFKGQWDKFPTQTRKKIITMVKDKIIIGKNKPILKADHECIWITKCPDTFQNAFSKDSLADPTTIRLALRLKKKIRSFNDFPKKGIIFKDTTLILRDSRLFREIVDYVAEKYRDQKIDLLAAKDMQGLIWTGAIALKLGVGIIPMFRKDLPGELVSTIYAHEYNPRRVLNLQKEAIKPGQRVLIVDYMIATGETVRNMIRLIEHLGGKIAGVFSIIELTHLGSRNGLGKYNIHTIVKY